jgi:hypothetical protein
MKRTLQEDLERIHSITYGKQVIQEGLLDDILKKVGLKKGEQTQKVDDPKRADLVSADVNDFFSSLENASKTGLSQQQRGSMTFQKDVESLQIGLMLLGYQLPKYGVDGLFGPETSSAVRKFMLDHPQPVNEAAEEIRTTLDNLGYNEKGNELSSGGDITDRLSGLVVQILTDFKKLNPSVKITATGGNDKFHKTLNYKSKHTEGNAVDLTLNPYNSKTDRAFREVLDSYKSKDSNFTYIDEYTNPSGASTGGHFHLQYGKGSSSSGGNIVATPEMINTLISLLKVRGVKSEELKQYIDSAITTGGGANFTDLDLTTEEGYNAYAQICQRFIDRRKPNLLGITGEMMANGAKGAFTTYRKYVPPELALAQLVAEGGIGNGNANSRPIRTRNPFNVGNTDSGANVEHNDVQSGINTYYNLIAKDYLVKGKTASDLVQNFVNKSGNRYASAAYEPIINKLAGEANRIAAPVYASLNKSKSSDTNVA